jgi:hypothetical protein
MNITKALLPYAPKALEWIGTKTPANSSIWSVFTSFLASGKGTVGTVKNVLLSGWNNFSPTEEKGSAIRLAKLGGGALFSVWAAANAMGSYEKARAAYHNTGNADGSILFSSLQSLAYGASAVLPAVAILAPGPIRALMQNSPLVGILPGLIGLAGDHFQALCTCDASHPLVRLAQAGQGNWLVNLKQNENPVYSSRSVLMPWWYRNVRALDESFMHSLGYKDFKRPTYSSSLYEFTPRPTYNQNA